jgi:ABC-type Na+ efflux pump permease subunit
MLKDALFIAWHDASILLRQRETLLWTFLMPALFFYFIGTVAGGGGVMSGGISTPLAVVVEEDAGFLADEVVLRLEQQDYDVTRFDAGVPRVDPETGAELTPDGWSRRLTVPSGFTADVLAGEPRELSFDGGDGGGLGAGFDEFRLHRGAYTVLADVIAAAGGAGGAALTAADVEAVRTAPRSLVLDVSSAGARAVAPTGFDQSVPGTMVMFTMIVLLTGGATMLLTERKEGLLRRLASSPMSRESIVLGKWLGKLALAAIQIGFAMLLGAVAFGVDWGPNLPVLLLVMACYAGFLAALAILLGNFAKSEGQAIALGVLSANVFGALGGCWWPIEITSDTMQRVALFLPTGWAMDALHKLVFFGQGADSVYPHVIGMALGTLVLGKVCARTFRFQ